MKQKEKEEMEQARNKTRDKNKRKKLPEWIDNYEMNGGVGYHDDTIAVTEETRELHDSPEIFEIEVPEDTQEQDEHYGEARIKIMGK